MFFKGPCHANMKGEDGRSLLEMALDGDFPEGYLLPTSD